MEEKIRELKGANLNISLDTLPGQIVMEQDECPMKNSECKTKNVCVLNNVRVCKYFRGIKVTPDRPDIILCAYPGKK